MQDLQQPNYQHFWRLCPFNIAKILRYSVLDLSQAEYDILIDAFVWKVAKLHFEQLSHLMANCKQKLGDVLDGIALNSKAK